LPRKVQSAGRPDRRKKRAAYRPATPATQSAPGSATQRAPVATAPAAATMSSARSAWGTPRSASRNTGTIRDEDHNYIYADLRRIGILTALVFLVLIALTVILK